MLKNLFYTGYNPAVQATYCDNHIFIERKFKNCNKSYNPAKQATYCDYVVIPSRDFLGELMLQSRCAGYLLRRRAKDYAYCKEIYRCSYNPAVQATYCDTVISY